MLDHLEEIQSRHQLFSDIRGEGLLIGAELVPEYHGKAKQFLTAATEQGLMMLIADPKVLRFTPSLIIPDEDMKPNNSRQAQCCIDADTSLFTSRRRVADVDERVGIFKRLRPNELV